MSKPIRILRRRQTCDLVGMSPTRVDVLERRGEFPQRVRISERAVGWLSDEIEAWILARPRAADVPPDKAGNPRLQAGQKVRQS